MKAGVFIGEMRVQGLMGRLGSQLVDLESHQNENGVILGFLSRRCVCHRLGAYALYTHIHTFCKPRLNRSKMGFQDLGLVSGSWLGLSLDYIGSLLGIVSSLDSIHNSDHFGREKLSRHQDAHARPGGGLVGNGVSIISSKKFLNIFH